MEHMEQTEQLSPPPAQSKFEWRLLIFLCALGFLAGFAILPYSLSLSAGSLGAVNGSENGLPAEIMPLISTIVVIVVTVGQTVLFNWPLTALGMLVARPLGLGAPLFSAWLYRRPWPVTWKKDLLIGILTGLVGGVLLLLLSTYVFGPLMEADLLAHGVEVNVQFSALDGLLASFGAAVNEEILLRLFLLSALAWLGFKLFRQTSGPGFLLILWIANLGSALIFGLFHISNLYVLDMPFTLAIVGGTIVMNGLIGLLFGWLYWKHGLESAMLSHFFVDIVLKVITVLFIPGFM